jgi:DNA-binding response OmpR family regulator
MARLLLIHGEELIRDHLAAALRCQGHDVTTASSRSIIDDPPIGDTQDWRYDLIIADETLPATASASTIQLLQLLYPDTKMLTISRPPRGNIQVDGDALSRRAAACATLSRPFSTADLFRTVDRILHAHAATDAAAALSAKTAHLAE